MNKVKIVNYLNIFYKHPTHHISCFIRLEFINNRKIYDFVKDRFILLRLR
jgi:hypothetical protein